MIRRIVALSVFHAWPVFAFGLEEIGPAEMARGPSPSRIAALVDEAGQLGWGPLVEPLRATALSAYEARPEQALAWYSLYRWAALLGTPESKALPAWIQAVTEAKAGHGNMATNYPASRGSLAARWSRELQLFALGSPSFSEEFFSTLSPLDNPLELLRILQVLYAADPARFAEYQNLAIALAVVHDVPPPPDWPHGQVSPIALPRQLAEPVVAFNYWAKKDRSNLTAHRLRRLPASELKFLVDVVAPFSELDWAQRNVSPPLGDFAKAYDLVKYRPERVAANQYLWTHPRYDLPAIFAQGGICVDQAYFAATAGKARGIPTLLFRGAGLDGRHAWFGFLSPNGWVLDAGRYADQRYVAGLAHDPQTWTNISDHELRFLTERFRVMPTFKFSQLHAAFAAEFLRGRQFAAAIKSAREAVNRERRNERAWEILLAATSASGVEARGVEGILREAAIALARYPELEVSFTRRLIASLRARGETSLAAATEKHLAVKYQDKRADLTYAEAAAMLERSMAQDDLPTRIKVYNQVLEVYGRGAGVDFYDKVVVPFVAHLREQAQEPAAIQALERARRTLRVEKGSQLEQEFSRLAAKLKRGD